MCLFSWEQYTVCFSSGFQIIKEVQKGMTALRFAVVLHDTVYKPQFLNCD